MEIWADGLRAPLPVVAAVFLGVSFMAPAPTVSASMNGAAMTAPLPTITTTGLTSFYALLTAPTPTVLFGVGSDSRNIAPTPTAFIAMSGLNVASTAPMPFLTTDTGIGVSVTAPKPSFTAKSDGASIATQAPFPSLFGAFSGAAFLSAPMPQMFSVVFGPADTATTENPYSTPYPGWAINYETNAPSRYEGLAANSICHLNGVAYVANNGGIYAMNASYDAGQPIHASITLPKTDYGDSHNKRVPSAFVGVRSSGQMQLKAVTNNLSGLYYTVNPPDANMRGSRVKMGEGIDGRYWTFRLNNADGADFEVDSIEFNPIILKRHGV